MDKQYVEIKNNSTPVQSAGIPVLGYDEFSGVVTGLLKDESKHCPAYFCIDEESSLRFICCIADDMKNRILVLSHLLPKQNRTLSSLTPHCTQLHIFEREIHERYGVEFKGHPWLKPVRFPNYRFNKSPVMDNYPFYDIEGEELHEVGVGPIHAGVIEPGHFRFICNGEKVLHLEIHLGYQHRGIESLLLQSESGLRRSVLSESIAGDTSVGHALAHVQLIESLGNLEVSGGLQTERCIGLELERIAVHIGDTAALCGDVAYQLGQVVCEALRTTIINSTQLWCGNRFGKGLIRPGGTNFPLDEVTADAILKVLNDTGRRFSEITDRIYTLQTVLARFEDIGTVTREQALSIGAVGMAARTCGIGRDLRRSHPFQYFRDYYTEPVSFSSGDVLARGLLRAAEVKQSVGIINDLITAWRGTGKERSRPVYDYSLKPGAFAVSMVEGWRGEIFHSASTDEKGRIMNYCIKDPSLHNWMALALAVRNQEISDFPVCNKSFNLSYCGNDL